VLAVLVPPLAGCYEYVPVSGAPTPGMPVAFEVSDESRLALRDRVGRDTDRIEGVVVSATEQELTLRMEKVTDLRGDDTKWNGEQVAFARRDAARTFERRLNKVRTLLAVGLVSGAVLAFGMGSRFLSVGGGGLEPPGSPPPPAN
jgi:hypothetical protein